jgi:hypothetical protein
MLLKPFFVIINAEPQQWKKDTYTIVNNLAKAN